MLNAKYLKTTGIPLMKSDGDTYCKLIDVVKLIHHEMSETRNKELTAVLSRMEMRVCKNNFLLPDSYKEKSTDVPGRYAVGGCDKNNVYFFYVKSVDGKPVYTRRPCDAKLFVNCRDASACADFLDEEVSVLDWEENMTEEDRWRRQLYMPFPYDADDGFEDSIPVRIVT